MVEKEGKKGERIKKQTKNDRNNSKCISIHNNYNLMLRCIKAAILKIQLYAICKKHA